MTDLSKMYTDQFFSDLTESVISSANEIIPVILEFIQPKSVIDVGCGNGAWLTVWEKFGVNDSVGADGPYVKPENLLIRKERFIPVNLENGFRSDRKFDLITCLEVAEHLPEKSAETIIESLCMLGDVILFSAAIPGQEGIHHINEQFPSYWNTLFKIRNYQIIDCVRSRIWMNDKINLYYRQNIMFYVNGYKLDSYKILMHEKELTKENFIDIVHPDSFKFKTFKSDYYETNWNKLHNLTNDLLCKYYLKFKRKSRSLCSLLNSIT